jgi:hypothetical protein
MSIMPFRLFVSSSGLFFVSTLLCLVPIKPVDADDEKSQHSFPVPHGQRGRLYQTNDPNLPPSDPQSFADPVGDGEKTGSPDPNDPSKDIVTFDLGSKEDEAKIKNLWEGVKGGTPINWQWTRVNITASDLPSLEPFRLPVFFPTDSPTVSLLASINVNGFLNSGFNFTDGQIFNVNDGLISGAQFITFADATSLLSTPPERIQNVASAALPNFSGRVSVFGSSATSVIPEPPTSILLGIGTAGLFAYWLARRKM